MFAKLLRCTARLPPCRSFSAAANPLVAIEKLHESVVQKSVTMYKANEAVVKSTLDQHLSGSRVVLFMEGTPDAPKSQLGLNVVRILTQVQATPLVSIDVLKHPAILGYTVTKSQKKRTPHLYLDGNFYADHDALLRLYLAGTLDDIIGNKDLTTGAFADELPIATY